MTRMKPHRAAAPARCASRASGPTRCRRCCAASTPRAARPCIEQAQPRLAQSAAARHAGRPRRRDRVARRRDRASDRHIVVVGDFDCDGATACAVGVRGLRMLGARRVSHAVPNRIVHGYGLSPALVEELAALQPDLLVTVDHGIACHAGIAAAKARGWQVLVTDHHLPGEHAAAGRCDRRSEPARRCVPEQGAGRRRRDVLRAAGAAAAPARAGRVRRTAARTCRALLDLVAVGTVADLVPLDANNRALVGAGLRRLRAGQGCAGLRALIEVSQRDAATADRRRHRLCASAPRLNAAGRLEDMALGIECLLTDDLAPGARDRRACSTRSTASAAPCSSR